MEDELREEDWRVVEVVAEEVPREGEVVEVVLVREGVSVVVVVVVEVRVRVEVLVGVAVEVLVRVGVSVVVVVVVVEVRVRVGVSVVVEVEVRVRVGVSVEVEEVEVRVRVGVVEPAEDDALLRVDEVEVEAEPLRVELEEVPLFTVGAAVLLRVDE